MDIRQPHLCGLSLSDIQIGLAGLGFDPGPCDGMYGPLTRNAARKCRAAYRLGASGALGPELGRLIRLRLPAFRVTTRARVGQSLIGVAGELNTTVQAIIEGNRRKRYEDVFPGEQLVVHRRAALALDGGELRGLEWTFVARQMQAAAPAADTAAATAAVSDARRCFGIISVPAGRREAAADLIRQASRAGLRGIVLEVADSDLEADAAWPAYGL